jgi:hypothetical protein
VVEGGGVFLQPSPFWGWDTPQTTFRDEPGFTTVKTDAEGVRLRAETVAPLLLAIHIEGRALESGERIDTRESVLAALRARRVYATNGPRILLRIRLDGDEMGSILEAAAIRSETQQLEVRVASPLPLAQVDLVRGRAGREPSVDSVQIAGDREWSEWRTIPRLEAGEYVYVRAIQVDEGAAWSSPIFAR